MKKEFTFTHFVEWAFYGLLAFFAYKTYISVEALNTNVATVVERTAWHSQMLLDQGSRIHALEIKNTKKH